MVKYRPLKPSRYGSSRLCPHCDNPLVSKDDRAWFCEKCKHRGLIKDLQYKKAEISQNLKILTGERKNKK